MDFSRGIHISLKTTLIILSNDAFESSVMYLGIKVAINMKCGICRKIAMFVCPCQFILLCSDHLALHISQPGRHLGETLNISMSGSESEKLRSEALRRIQVIEDSKKKIASVTITLIMKIENSSKRAVQELDSLLHLYMTMLKLSSLSESLKLEVQKISETTFRVKEVSFDLGSIIEESFNQDLVIFTKTNEGARRFEATIQEDIKKTKEETEEVEKTIEVEKCIQGKQKIKKQTNKVKGIVSNTWTLAKKNKFMRSLKISNYQASFSGSKVDWIQDIKFSNNGNYSFICKNYEGKVE